MDLIISIKMGMVDLDADINDRFGFMAGKFEISLNTIKSVGLNQLKLSRRYDTLHKRRLTSIENGLIYHNKNLIDQKCFLGVIDKFTNSVESDVSFKIKSINALDDSIWQPNLITTRQDIHLENIVINVIDIGNGVL